MKKIYLDYAATTPVDGRVFKAMEPYFKGKFGNTMSLHSFGQEAKIALEESRQTMAGILGAKPNEIVFTSSATESNNLALKGIAFSASPAFAKASAGKHIIISSIEHPCIDEAAKWLSSLHPNLGEDSRGFKITKVPVDKYGMVNPKDVERAIGPDTILVSIIHASNEIGTIQPIAEIGKICRERKIYFHTDASQSFGKIPIDVKKMNIDLLTASSHKIYGPKGAGLLYVREGIKLVPLLHGGGQENGIRSSTINVPAIVGFAKAAEICQKEMQKESKRLIKLRDKLIKNVLKIKNSHLNGHPRNRLANNANFWFEFIEGESLIMQLDLEGIACSTGSACSSFKLEPSHVLLATGLKPQEAHGSLRVSLGRFTTEREINQLIKILPKIVKKIRELSPFK
jgi:cysteine desulfurase